MPIVYERAYGGWAADGRGWDQRNLAGIGFGTRTEHLIGTPAPCVERWEDPVDNWLSRPAPGGFGPVARHWLPRVQFAGTYDEAWQEHRAPLLPRDFDERFFLCAPEDQQFAKPLVGREPVRLLNLTPEGVVDFQLPRFALGLTTLIGRDVIYRRPVLRTILIEPDERRIIMVWHDALRCHGRKYLVHRTEIVSKVFL
jgi:hypothetical protein